MESFLSPNHLTRLLSSCKTKSTLSKIHALLISTGFSADNNIITKIIASYGRIGDITTARKVFDKTPMKKTLQSYNAIIIAYSRKSQLDEAICLYNQMITNGVVKPDSSTFTVVIKSCVNLMDIETGEKVWRKAVESGYEYDMFVRSSVLNLYAKSGKMDEAKAVFDQMKTKDVVCWTTMVTGFAVSGRGSEAVESYRRMRSEGHDGDSVVMLGLIRVGDLNLGLSVHGFMIRKEKDYGFDVKIQTSLIDMYAKNGLLDIALRVFDKTTHRNAVSWAVLISGFAQNGFAGKSLELIREMQCFELKPDSVCLVSGLLACSQIGLLKLGKSVHGYIVRRFEFDQVIIATALIDMYSKCGVMKCSRTVFDRLEFRDSFTWNTMIAGYGTHGVGKESLDLFLEMIESGLKPDEASFGSLLSALSHSGLVREGRHWFSVMVDEYDIQPSEKHYACFVDLLSRAGRVEEAFRLIRSLSYDPGLTVWVALLSGCLNHGKFSVGEMAVKKILELNPVEPGVYTLISNFFASGKKWDDVAGVRKMMKRIGSKKVPGYSVVELNGELHGFVMEDKSHFKYRDILYLSNILDREMRDRVFPDDTEVEFWDDLN